MIWPLGWFVAAAGTGHLLDERADLAPKAESPHTIADASSGVLSELRTTLDVLRGNEVDERQPTPGLDRLADLTNRRRGCGRC